MVETPLRRDEKVVGEMENRGKETEDCDGWEIGEINDDPRIGRSQTKTSGGLSESRPPIQARASSWKQALFLQKKLTDIIKL